MLEKHKGFGSILFSLFSNCYTWKPVKHTCREPDKLLTNHVKKVGQVAHSLEVGRFIEKKKKGGKKKKERKKPVQRANGMVVFTKVKSTQAAVLFILIQDTVLEHNLVLWKI